MKLKYNDPQHAYWIDGKRCKGVTGIAGIPDDTYGLQQWAKRMIVRGIAGNAALNARGVAAGENKNALEEVAEAALKVAGSGDKAQRGTDMHGIVEAHSRGLPIVHTPQSRALCSAWDKAIASAGLTIEPEYVERIVCYPSQLIAGRSDAFATKKRAKSMPVVDLKTGKVDYPHKMAVQLALYANAPTLAGMLDGNGETQTFTDNADLDLKTAYIVHIPTPEEVQIYTLDIRAGWEIAKKAIFPILEWRKKKDLLKVVSTTPIIDPEAHATDEHVAWIKARLTKIAATSEMARNLTITRWPHGVTPREPWSEGDIDKLDEALITVERDGEVPF